MHGNIDASRVESFRNSCKNLLMDVQSTTKFSESEAKFNADVILEQVQPKAEVERERMEQYTNYDNIPKRNGAFLLACACGANLQDIALRLLDIGREQKDS